MNKLTVTEVKNLNTLIVEKETLQKTLYDLGKMLSSISYLKDDFIHIAVDGLPELEVRGSASLLNSLEAGILTRLKEIDVLLSKYVVIDVSK
jgi:hypothetical protein